jgi:hypothetical protein
MFLNSKNKKSYLKDFQKLLKEDSGFWSLDSDLLINALIEINKNKNIQSLYSKHDKCDESYLFFAYSKEKEEFLFKYILPSILNRFNSEYKCFYEFLAPRDNLNQGVNHPIDIGAVCDPLYFKINHIRLSLESDSEQAHELFWKVLSLQLSQL